MVSVAALNFQTYKDSLDIYLLHKIKKLLI